MKQFKVSDLVLDFDLHPRNNVDPHNVRSLTEAMQAGADIPPIVIDRQSKKVIDGFHRIRAHISLHGSSAQISVIEKTYANDAEMFLDAMRRNSSHGAQLDQCDRTRCIITAERLSIPLEAVAGALRMPPGKLGSLRSTRTASTSAGLTVPLKRTVRHMAGRQLTQPQIDANKRSSGMHQSFYVNQIIDLIESDLLDTSDESVMGRLQVLHGLLDEMFAAA